MAATISVSCSKCRKTIKAPVTLKGKKIKCKGCGQLLTVSETTHEEDEWGVTTAYNARTVDLAPRCPFCAGELESETDVVCLHCGYNLQTREWLQQRVLEAVTAGDYFIWLLPGLASLLVALAFIGVIVCIWMKIGTPEWFNDMPSLRVYATVACGGIIWGGGFFAVKRLILNPHPPEVLKRKKAGEE